MKELTAVVFAASEPTAREPGDSIELEAVAEPECASANASFGVHLCANGS